MERRSALALGAALLLGSALAAPFSAGAETVLITGANSGLGLEFVKQSAAKGWRVIATHRRDDIPESLAPIVEEHSNVHVERMDVASIDDVRALAGKLDGEPIDVLINNAGIRQRPLFGQHIAAFAHRSDHVDALDRGIGGGFAHRHDRVIGFVQGRADQIVHRGIHNQEAAFAAAFHINRSRHENARLAD
jgi:NAD(P)-dependent dehydrogenase (short-subunit alcohol dehydrogenase family)